MDIALSISSAFGIGGACHNKINLLIGNGDGTFKLPTTYTYSGSSYNYRIAAGHLDNNGFKDLVVTSATSGFNALSNTGSGFTAGPLSSTPNRELTSCIIADLDNDGKNDVLVDATQSGVSGRIQLSSGQGNGTFKPCVTYGVFGGNLVGLLTIDVNKDGKTDIIGTNQVGSQQNLYLAIQSGTGSSWLNGNILLSNYSPQQVLDYNFDGFPDILAAKYQAGTNLFLGSVILLNDQKNSFYELGMLIAGKSGWLSDLNKDLLYDFICWNGNNIEVRLATQSLCTANPLNNGLFGYYPMEGNIVDVSGNGNHGIGFGVNNLIGKVLSYPPGIGGKAIYFDNFNHTFLSTVNSYVKLPSTSFAPSGGFTVSMWLYFKSLASEVQSPTLSGSIYQLSDCSTKQVTLSSTSNGSVSVVFSDGVNTHHSDTVNISNRWAQISIIFDKDSLHFYVDGQRKSTTILKNPLFTLPNAQQFLANGCASTTNATRFNGLIDQLRIYKRALTDQEVLQLAGSNAPICATNNLELFGPDGATKYLWKGPNSDSSSAQNPLYVKAMPKDSGIYRLVATYGTCQDTSYTKVIVNNCTLNTGLLAHYPFTDGSGADSSGNMYLGSIVGAATTTDRFGNCAQAISFDGKDDYFQLPFRKKMLPYFNDKTYSFWIKFKDTVNLFTFQNGDADNYNGQMNITLGGNGTIGTVFHSFQASGAGDKAAYMFFRNASTFNDGKFHLINLVINRKRVSYYLDGVFVAQRDWTLPYLPFDQNYRIEVGRVFNSYCNGYCQYFNGTLDELRIYDRLLSATEIMQLYQLPNPGGSKPPSLKVQLANGTSLCTSGSATLKATSETGVSYEWFLNNVKLNNQSKDTLRVTQKGTYQVRAYRTAWPSCDTTIGIQLDSSPVAPQTISYTYCQGASAAPLAANGISLQWYTQSAGGIPQNTLTPSTSISGLTTYFVTQSNACGESPRAATTVTVLPKTPLGITATKGTFCTGDSVKITASSAATLFQWNSGTFGAAKTFIAKTAGTYSVVAKDTAGCTNVAAIDLNTFAVNLPVVSNDTTICAGNNLMLGGTGTGTYLWSNGVTTSQNTVQPSSNATYRLTFTDSNGCKYVDSVVVKVNPKPIVDAGSDTIICNGTPVTLKASGNGTYSWSNGGMGQQTTVAPNITNKYYVTVTDNNGCKALDSVNVVVNAVPTPGIAGKLSFCKGSNTTITASGGITYLWTTSSTNQNLIVNTAGTYIVTVTNANGCKNNTSVMVVEDPLPAASINGKPSFCKGTSTNLTASGGNSYFWNNSNTSNSIIVSAIGTYAVTVTDANGCKNATSVTVVENALPVTSISGVLNFCKGANTTLTANGGINYLWNTSSTTQNLIVNTGGTYFVTATDANGCKNATSVMVTENALPAATISGKLSFCKGSSTSLTASGGITYLWNTSSTNQNLIVNTGGTYFVTATNASGCKNATSVMVVEDALPTATISGKPSFCKGSSTNLIASGGNSYFWNNSNTSNSIMVATIGTYAVTVTDANGCKNADTVQVTENALPVVSINGKPSFCKGTSTNLTASGGNSFLWSNGSKTQDVVVATDGPYSVTVTDANGCKKYHFS